MKGFEKNDSRVQYDISNDYVSKNTKSRKFFDSFKCCNPHLSKRSSDLKQNGTQEKTPFSSTVFHTLSHGVFGFVASVSSTSGWLKFFTGQSEPSIQWFL